MTTQERLDLADTMREIMLSKGFHSMRGTKQIFHYDALCAAISQKGFMISTVTLRKVADRENRCDIQHNNLVAIAAGLGVTVDELKGKPKQ